MSTIEDFSTFLGRAFPKSDESVATKIPKSNDSMAIKIAIIDDGVDANLVSLDGKIAIGKSFCPYANSSELIGPYYVPTGNHGTCMASIISRICPEVSLYVARLDERVSQRSRSNAQFTTKSAAEAIRWAASCGVDIISMSWTIEAPAINNEEMSDLKDAVALAHQKKILMFCSTSDQGSSSRDICYPRDFDGCIRIGGASDSGEPLSWVNATKVDFLLPGKNVPFKNNEDKISYESGSSVATAAASGLAGLLLYCGRILDRHAGSTPSTSSDSSAPSPLLTRGLGSSASLLSSSSMSSSATVTAAGTGREGKEGPRAAKLRDKAEMMGTFGKMCKGESQFPDVQSLVEKKFAVWMRNVRGEQEKNGDQRGGGGRVPLPQQLKSKDLQHMKWDDEMFRALDRLFVDLFPQIA